VSEEEEHEIPELTGNIINVIGNSFSAVIHAGDPGLKDDIRFARQKAVKALIPEIKDSSLWCVPPGTSVYTPNSIETVAQAGHENTSVFTHERRFDKVMGRSKRKYEGELVSIDVKYTNFPIRLTPEHKVLVARDVREPQSSWKEDFNPSPKWVEAGDLTERDFLTFPRFKETEDMSIVNGDLAELMGRYVADGWINNGCVNFSFGKEEKEDIKRTKDLIESCFGKRPNPTEHRTDLELCLGERKFALLFADFGESAKKKNIPLWFLKLPKSKQYRFLKGLIEGDGCVSDYFIFITRTISKKLAFRLRLLLSRLGVLHSLEEKEQSKEKVIEGRDVSQETKNYLVKVGGDGARKVSNKAGINYDGGETTSGSHGFVGKRYLYFPIAGIEREEYEGYVYNIETNPANSYVLPQGTVHNCQFKHTCTVIVNLHEQACKAQRRGEPTEGIEETIGLYRKLAEIFWAGMITGDLNWAREHVKGE